MFVFLKVLVPQDKSSGTVLVSWKTDRQTDKPWHVEYSSSTYSLWSLAAYIKAASLSIKFSKGKMQRKNKRKMFCFYTEALALALALKYFFSRSRNIVLFPLLFIHFFFYSFLCVKDCSYGFSTILRFFCVPFFLQKKHKKYKTHLSCVARIVKHLIRETITLLLAVLSCFAPSFHGVWAV